MYSSIRFANFQKPKLLLSKSTISKSKLHCQKALEMLFT